MALETRVWLGTKGRFLTGVLRLDGDRLSFLGDRGTALDTTVAASEPRFVSETRMSLFVRGRKLFVWFRDPQAAPGGGPPSLDWRHVSQHPRSP